MLMIVIVALIPVAAGGGGVGGQPQRVAAGYLSIAAACWYELSSLDRAVEAEPPSARGHLRD